MGIEVSIRRHAEALMQAFTFSGDAEQQAAVKSTKQATGNARQR